MYLRFRLFQQLTSSWLLTTTNTVAITYWLLVRTLTVSTCYLHALYTHEGGQGAHNVTWRDHYPYTPTGPFFAQCTYTIYFGMTKHISHTCGRRSCRPARFVKQYWQPYFRAVSCNNSSSVFLDHYQTLRTKQRRGSKASGFWKQCHEGSTPSSHEMTPLI